MKRSNRKHIILISVLSLLWVVMLIMYLHDTVLYYRYPFIQDWPRYLLRTGTRFLLLPALLAGYVVLYKWGKGNRWAVCALLAVLAVPVTFFGSLSEVLSEPSVCSHTTSPSDFGQYDEHVSIRNTQFPETIPPEAEDVQYIYCYSEASGSPTYLAVSWRYADIADYEHMTAQQEGTFSVNHQGENISQSKGEFSAYYETVILDPQEQRVYFVAANIPSAIPASGTDVFSWEFSY